MAKYVIEELGFDTLYEALSRRTAVELKEIAKVLTSQKATRKEDCINIIMKALEGNNLRHLWESFDEISQLAVAEVAHGVDDCLDLYSFVAKYGKEPVKYYCNYLDRSDDMPWTSLDAIFTNDYMPRELKERFRAFVPEPEPSQVKTTDTLPAKIQHTIIIMGPHSEDIPAEQVITVSETESAALHDFIAVLRLIDAGKVSVSPATYRPTLAGAKAVQTILRDGDFGTTEPMHNVNNYISPYAWPLLVQSAGFARLKGSKLELTKKGRDATTRPAHEVIKQLWESWLNKGLIDEFSRIDEIKGQKRKGRKVLTDVCERRAVVTLVLTTCPAGEWIELDEFFRHFQATGIEFQMLNDLWALYILDQQYGNLGYDGFHEWTLIQGRYVMALLWEYAATLGLVDIAHIPPMHARTDFWDIWGTEDLEYLSQYDGLKYFRITPLGAYCLGMAETYSPGVQRPRRPAFKVLPNRDIVIQDAEAFTTADALFLERIACQNGDHTWTLDKTRLLDALESGFAADDIIKFLDSTSQTPLPDNVRCFIDDTVQRASLVSWEGSAEVFHVKDKDTALLITHDTNPTSAVVL